MGYQESRRRVIEDAYSRRLTRFLDSYVPGRPTAVFLPGGMGSQLRTTRARFREGAPMDHRSHVAWYDTGLLFERDIERLAMERVDGAYEDFERHIVTPDGEVRFLFKPYDDLFRALFNAQYNVLSFGFDWRRSLIEGVGFFHSFLEELRDRTKAAFDEDPLPQLRIVAHSQGGLILHLWLLRTFRSRSVTSADADRWFHRAVAVGTPFFGTTNHMPRLWRGEPAFNLIVGEDRMRRIVASMPGPYILMPLDADTWEAKRDRIGLDEYPVVDGDGAPADPYAADHRDRFPAWVDRDALAEAGQLRATLRRELAPALHDRVFNFRSKANGDTWHRIEWRAGAGPRGVGKGPGDGTVPVWAGALPELPAAQVVDLVQAADHVGLMEHGETLGHLLRVFGDSSDGAALASASAAGLAACSRARLDAFLGDVQSGHLTRDQPRASDPSVWRRILEETGRCGD